MELLLLSSSRTPAGYLTDYLADIKALGAGVRHAVFVPYAAVSLPWDEYRAKVGEALGGLELHPPEDLANTELIIVGGGNTFHLLHECRKRGLLELIGDKVRSGTKYLGWSAGANLACPTIKTTNDMPIVDPGGLGALGLIAFQINPHYLSIPQPGHHGETRDERLAEFARANPGLPVIGLPEGDWLRVSGSSIELRGRHPAKWWHAGKAPESLRPICTYEAGTWRQLAASNVAYEEKPLPRTRR